MIKSLSKQRIEGNFPDLMNAGYKKPTANVSCGVMSKAFLWEEEWDKEACASSDLTSRDPTQGI